MSTLLIADVPAIFRRYHSTMGQDTYCENFPVGGIVGTLRCILRLINDHDATHFLAAFDGEHEHLVRRKEYSEYKINRKRDEEIVYAYEWLKELLPLMGGFVLKHVSQEADDFIASAVQEHQQNCDRIIVVTTDKDLAELLVYPNVVLVHPTKYDTLNSFTAFEKFGVTPKQMPDYLALLGDKADDIPGVEGVGAKTAARWLNLYGSLENIIANAKEIKGKAAENLLNSRRNVLYFRDFLKLRPNLGIPSLEQIDAKQPDMPVLKQRLRYLGFDQFANSLDNTQENGPCM